MSISALPHLDRFDRPVSLPPVRAIPETFMSGNDRSWLQKIFLGKITQLLSPPLSDISLYYLLVGGGEDDLGHELVHHQVGLHLHLAAEGGRHPRHARHLLETLIMTRT